jgi:uncharacterized protein YaaR (DUF327 family)
MKVGEASNQFPEFPQQKKVRDKGAAGAAKAAQGAGEAKAPEFSETFLAAAEGGMRASFDELMAGIVEQGERLARSQNFAELSRYKDLVRGFVAKLSKTLYRVKPSDGGAARPGSKVYVILQKVDAEMENLAKLVLAGQVPQLRILQKLDQIRGLLLDAYK